MTGAAGLPGPAAALARLRPMRAGDLTAVLALENALFPEDAWSPEMFADEVAQPGDSRRYLVAERAPAAGGGHQPGELAGYAGVMFVPGAPAADVLTIAVASPWWGHGIGSALLAALIAAARERGCQEMFLEVRADNPRARGLYERRGFAKIGVRRGYYQPAGVDAVVMRKDLTRPDAGPEER